jgi:DNA (cytosine-5)-methyltransferase 1
MRYGSVCSGIEAATAAWHHMGWEAAFFSEIEKFPCAVLQHHYPDVPLHGDFTTIKENEYGKIDLLVGGTPCQSFSVAGLRGGLDDDRGNLALEFCRLAQREQPRWIVWENVPGVLSSNGGRDFGSILGALENIGYGLAYRVLDAQYFGVAQRRRRVFVVGYLGDWRPAAAVLFERESMSGHPAPSRQARQEVAGTIARSSFSGGAGGRPDGAAGNHFVAAKCLTARGAGGGNLDPETANLIAYPINSMNAFRSPDAAASTGLGVGHDGEAMYTLTKGDHHAVAFASNMSQPDFQVDGTCPTIRVGSGGKSGNPPAVAYEPAIGWSEELTASVDLAGTLQRGGSGGRHDGVMVPAQPPIGFDAYNNDVTGDVTKTIDTGQDYHHVPNVLQSTVRRLTPVECERLQGFPDNFTAIPWRKKGAEDCPDGPRYKALGNSMAVPVMRWIGERIQMIEEITE